MIGLLAVIGDPVAHSLSPVIHNAWLTKAAEPYRYEKLRVSAEELPAFLDRVRSGEVFGANVTLPHKQAVFAACERLTPAAEAMGAVNTLLLDPESGLLCGDNTDAEGFMAALAAKAPAFKARGSRVCLLGAGGAARALIYGLLQGGAAHVTVCARNPGKAAALLRFGSAVEVASWGEARVALARADLAVNTVPPGDDHGEGLAAAMAPWLRPELAVCDIVYYPLMTPLLREAGARGCLTVTGEGMLLHQAAAAYLRWFGYAPDVQAGESALLRALGAA